MVMTDPLGDMLTRIRNGQQARKATIVSPNSRLRVNVLDVLKREGYIRAYSSAEVRPGLSELTIELKYLEGEPVIKAGPPRLHEDRRPAEALQRPRHLDPVDAAGRHVGHRGAGRQCRRRSALPRVLGEESGEARCRVSAKIPFRSPPASTSRW